MTNLENKIAEIARLGITCIKNAANPYFNSTYADLGAVVEALKVPLGERKVGYYFMSNGAGNDWLLTMTVVNLEDKEDEPLVLAFPLNPTNPQQMGASITYAKRYLLCTAFNVIAEEDDDGNKASGNDVKSQPTMPKKKPVPMQVNKIDGIDDEVPNFFN